MAEWVSRGKLGFWKSVWVIEETEAAGNSGYRERQRTRWKVCIVGGRVGRRRRRTM